MRVEHVALYANDLEAASSVSERRLCRRHVLADLYAEGTARFARAAPDAVAAVR